MSEKMNTTSSARNNWTPNDEREWLEKTKGDTEFLNSTSIEINRLPFQSMEVQTRIANTVQIAFGEYAKDIRITNRFYLTLDDLIEAYTEWKNSTDETRAQALEDLENTGMNIRQKIISSNLLVIRAIEIANPTEEETGDVMRKYLDTFLKELVQKVVEPVFQKTLK